MSEGTRLPANPRDPWIGFRGSKPAFVLFILLLPIIVVFAVVVAVLWLVFGLPYILFLYGAVFALWLPRGKDVLFVYSNSPHWKDYIEANVLPRLVERAVLLNWSDRSSWDRWSLPIMCFRHFAGAREFNPIAIVFRPFRRAKVFRFWRAFRDYKHGKTEVLQEVENAFFAHLDVAAGADQTSSF